MVTVADFGLDDFLPDGTSGTRRLRLHLMYLRQSRRMGVPFGQIFTVADVAARDLWCCYGCSLLVPPRWTAEQLRLAPALTFAQPWADGGRYDKANARLAHFGCASFTDQAFAHRVGQLLTRDMTVKAHAGRWDETCLKGHELAGPNLLKATDGRRRCRRCRNDRESAPQTAGTT